MPLRVIYCIISAMAQNSQNRKTPKSLHAEVMRQMLTLATSGFGLVAALAWNNVIQEFVSEYVKKWLPQGSGLFSLLIYALIITALAVFITLQLSKLAERLKE